MKIELSKTIENETGKVAYTVTAGFEFIMATYDYQKAKEAYDKAVAEKKEPVKKTYRHELIETVDTDPAVESLRMEQVGFE